MVYQSALALDLRQNSHALLAGTRYRVSCTDLLPLRGLAWLHYNHLGAQQIYFFVFFLLLVVRHS